MSTSDHFKIAIIGSGFSGSLVAAQLLGQSTSPLTIHLIESRHPFSLGVAYSTQEAHHLLNVRAENMSAFPDDATHFLSWAQSQQHLTSQIFASKVQADTFVPRQLYGTYLQAVLNEAEANAKPDVRLERLKDEAIAIEQTRDGTTVHLRSQRRLQVHKVVLALGNFPPSHPPVDLPDFYDSNRYVGSAWSAETLSGLKLEEPILLIGASHTMVDLVRSLESQAHRGTIHVVSRHGLLPYSHSAKTSYYSGFDVATLPKNIRALMHQIRSAVRVAEDQGQDWQAVVDSLRPITPQLWQSLSLAEQRRFLRHVRPYWEICRSRLPPESAEVVARLRHSNQLIVHPGQIQSYYEDSSGVDVMLRKRHMTNNTVLRVSRVVNCTGPTSNYQKLQAPLVISLREQGLIYPNELGLGLKTAPNGALLDAAGVPSKLLYTLGPPRKGDLWESIATPEIRVQAQVLAQELLSRSRIAGDASLELSSVHRTCKQSPD